MVLGFPKKIDVLICYWGKLGFYNPLFFDFFWGFRVFKGEGFEWSGCCCGGGSGF